MFQHDFIIKTIYDLNNKEIDIINNLCNLR